MNADQISYKAVFFKIIQMDMILTFRRNSEFLYPVIFFSMVVSLFPFAIGPEKTLLQQFFPAVIWVTALLATLLSLESLLKSDFDDGQLEQYVLTPVPLMLVIVAKLVAHWLASGLPLCITAYAASMLTGVSAKVSTVILISLLLGTPGLSAIGAIGSALTVSIRKNSLLLTLIILPLYIPFLIFGAGAINASMQDLDWSGHIYLLAALSVFIVTLAPIAITGAVKISLN